MNAVQLEQYARLDRKLKFAFARYIFLLPPITHTRKRRGGLERWIAANQGFATAFEKAKSAAGIDGVAQQRRKRGE